MCLYSKGSLFLDSISVVENFKFRTNTGSLINAYYSKPEMYQIPNLSTKDPVHKSIAEEKRSINISRNFPAFQLATIVPTSLLSFISSRYLVSM